MWIVMSVAPLIIYDKSSSLVTSICEIPEFYMLWGVLGLNKDLGLDLSMILDSAFIFNDF